MLEWNEEFGIKNQHLDGQHKQLLSYVEESYVLLNKPTAEKPLLLKKLASNLIMYAKKHFQDEETYMKHINYIHLEEHKAIHKEIIQGIKETIQNMNNVEESAKKLHIFLKESLLRHILEEDKKIETYRNRIREINEMPYSLEVQTKIFQEVYGIKDSEYHTYVCLCYLKENQVCEALHKLMQEKQSFIRCKICKQPLVALKQDIQENEEAFEKLAKDYFKQF
ncbi:bacteriohemerythrin [Helicobacter burdigaliensis]|uniref:bacteriohemerythrin n=1 Tax=Helicobacter burdigaliensis TaxID=2315334 RepID=UPI00130050B5|nr:hemerythrin domain-containing protein [Helicobacter burdigaliensis]